MTARGTISLKLEVEQHAFVHDYYERLRCLHPWLTHQIFQDYFLAKYLVLGISVERQTTTYAGCQRLLRALKAAEAAMLDEPAPDTNVFSHCVESPFPGPPESDETG